MPAGNSKTFLAGRSHSRLAYANHKWEVAIREWDNSWEGRNKCLVTRSQRDGADFAVNPMPGAVTVLLLTCNVWQDL